MGEESVCRGRLARSRPASNVSLQTFVLHQTRHIPSSSNLRVFTQAARVQALRVVAKAKREAEGRVSLSAEWSVEGNCWIVADAFTMHEDDEVRRL
jgi:hypothetical protein